MKRLVIYWIAALVLFMGWIATVPNAVAVVKTPTPVPASGNATKTPTPTGTAATGPLAARIGGTKASFDAKYGPAVTGGTTKPNTAVYNVKNYGQVAIVFNGDQVVAISAIADRANKTSLTTPDAKDWSLDTATQHAKSFLPEDATFAPRNTKGNGKVTRDCTSPALAKAVSASVMTKLGVQGKPGDCSYVLTEDTKGNISAFTVAIGSTGATSQTAAATTATVVPTQASAKATKSTSGASGASSGSAVTKHCSDFKTQAEAQAYFDSVGGDNSPQGRALDADKDGKACESLK